jgi:hypothetical protein
MKRLSLLLVLFSCLILIGCGGGDESITADAGEDFSIQIEQSPTFDGCGSTGDIQNYRWTIIEAPDKMVGDSGKIIRELDTNCSFTLEAAMGVDEVGTWVIELEVSNPSGDTATDQVIVNVNG